MLPADGHCGLGLKEEMLMKVEEKQWLSTLLLSDVHSDGGSLTSNPRHSDTVS